MRSAKFTSDDILDAASAALACHGHAATISQVSSMIDVPVGSIYHRFPSRHHLFASLWIRSINRFHEGLLATVDIDDPREALLAQAVHQPRFCRQYPHDALAMTLYSQRDLLNSGPEALKPEVEGINDEIWANGRQQAQAVYGTSDAHAAKVAALAVWQTPYGMIRGQVRTQTPISTWIDDAVLAAAGAILDLVEPA